MHNTFSIITLILFIFYYISYKIIWVLQKLFNLNYELRILRESCNLQRLIHLIKIKKNNNLNTLLIYWKYYLIHKSLYIHSWNFYRIHIIIFFKFTYNSFNWCCWNHTNFCYYLNNIIVFILPYLYNLIKLYHILNLMKYIIMIHLLVKILQFHSKKVNQFNFFLKIYNFHKKQEKVFYEQKPNMLIKLFLLLKSVLHYITLMKLLLRFYQLLLIYS